MKYLSFKFIGVLFFLAFYSKAINAQVMDPSDPIVIYNSAAPPTQPAWGQVAKWVKTNRLNWNTSNYKCYIYKGMQFRLRFPKTYQHNVNDGKKYPIMVFFHGIGEKGTVYDNEYQLYHGGQTHDNAVNNGKFDGFLLYPQSQSGWFGNTTYDFVQELIENFLVPQNKVDINRVIVDGLSGGGSATWEFMIRFPKLVAAGTPISAASLSFSSSASTLKWIPIWHFQGGLDRAPDPSTSEAMGAVLLNAGANYKYTKYPTQGHGCWNTAWAESDYFPYISRAYKSNPWVLYGQTEFCPGVAFNVTIGVSQGFDEYQWRKNGVAYGGNTNQISVTTVGVYDCRFRRGSSWSEWSPIPVEIKTKAPTVSPPIQITGLKSRHIPSPDGSTSVPLEIPSGYTSYDWQKVGSNTTLSTANTLAAGTAGDYHVKVTEQFGCSSEFSSVFTVIDANGPNKPDPAINTIVTALSKTQLRLNWSDNPSPTYDETGFEIYQSESAGGPYTLIAITGANVLSYQVENLKSNSKYYYIIRAINATGAATASAEASGTTLADTQAPTAPYNLQIVGTSQNSISLQWSEATDDVNVEKYDVYINGVKSYVTTQTSFTVYNLVHAATYNFSIRARDFANNVSPFSNQVTGQPLLVGLPYKYYTFTGTWNNLPDFTTLTPVATGVMPSVALTPRTQNDNFAFLWEGYIVIPQSGTYYFRTNSDDGSRLWLGSLNGSGSPYSFGGVPTVNNDGLHGGQNRDSGPQVLTAGVYPIAIAFYEQGGGEAMTVSWRTPSTGTSFVTIPASAFSEPAVPGGSAPVAPGGLSATAVSYNQIDLSWVDNSNNESGFEIWRSENATTGFVTVGNAGANATSYSDHGLAAGTTYYYKIRSIGLYGESDLVPADIPSQANWKFNNSYSDASGNAKVISAGSGSAAPTFNTDRQEGSHSVDLDGSNDYINVNSSSGDYLRGGYNAKTVAFWMKADVTTSGSTRLGIFDFGGSDDGLAMYIQSNNLYAGVASNNTRRSISTSYNSTGWNHIALVYDANTLRLYVNGISVASNTNLGFTSVGTTTNGSRIGDDNSTTSFGTTTNYFGFFNGKLDNFWVVGSALSASEINSLISTGVLGGSPSATTLPLPGVPLSPSGLVASGVSNSQIGITWVDNSTDETGYELYRSSNNNSNYLLFATLPSNTTSYQDEGLFANSIHYYKVRAVNVGGNSGYSNEDSAKTVNNAPVVTPIAGKSMRYDGTLLVQVAATDVDAELLNVVVSNLPSFGVYTPTGNGTGSITFNNPGAGQQGLYTGITVTVTDQHGGSSVTMFDLDVNDNYAPVITGVTDITLDEQQTGQLNFSASDLNAGDVLSWSFVDMPSFVTPVITGNAVQLNLAPGYADNGPHTVTVLVADGNGGADEKRFTITVNDIDPNKRIYVNFTDGSLTSGSPWNNTNKVPALNDVFGNLNDENGVNSGIGLQVTSSWQSVGNGTNTLGGNTGNNSGVYPDNVMRSAYWTDNRIQSIRITGLLPSNKYNFTFFGSRGGVSDNRTTTYTINGNSVSLNAASNTQNTVSLTDLQPNVDGTLNLTVERAAGSSYGYLNALVIASLYNDGTAPAKARDLTAHLNGTTADLTWVDAAYNESSYQVYRSTSLSGPYSLVSGSLPANSTGYANTNLGGNTTYYYYVTSENGYGVSPSSDTVSVTTPNTAPVLSAIGDVQMKTEQVFYVNITATDEPGDNITLNVTGLPSFATYTNTGNGTGTITITPGSATGTYEGITVTATDNSFASSSSTFKIIVTDKDITSVYVNFNQVLPVGSPWNSFNNTPLAGRTISNLVNDEGATTGISVALLDLWSGANDVGAFTGNNSGVYPDDVMKTAYYEASTSQKHVRISGLATSGVKYNLVFFGSRIASDNRNTIYRVGGQSVTLNAAGNTTNTVQINGLIPNASGQLEFTVEKAAGSSYGYLNAMVIQSYVDNGLPLAPSNLVAAGKSKTSIQLNWQDKSDNETGFEIYRSATADGVFSLLATVGANVTTYLNQGLAINSAYYYKVRAVKGAVYSSYSNTASAATHMFSVFMNFNRDNPAAAPWNNANVVPQENDVFTNLVNDQNAPSGISLTVTDNFSGENPFGMLTGNNSGVYPDNVMRASWWLDIGETAQLKVSGLNQSLAYSFVFFGSRDGGGNRTTVYTVNGNSVSLNAAYNTSQTVQIDNIRPDENGEVLIDLSVPAGSQFGYINSLVINGYQAPEVSGGGSPGTGRSVPTELLVNQNTVAPAPAAATVSAERGTLAEEPMLISKIGAFPNPFTDHIIVSSDLKRSYDQVTISLIDMSGRVLVNRSLRGLSAGLWNYTLDLSGITIQPGVYVLRLQTSDKNTSPAVFKVVKTK